MPRSLELHLQEGFSGQAVIVAVDAQVCARFDARTRLQLGLAHVETLSVEPGQTVTVEVPSLGLRQAYAVADQDTILTANLVDHALILRPARGPVGYF